VKLRRVEAADADFLLELITHDETRRFLGNRAADTPEQVLADIERSQREPESFGWYVGERDGRRIGCVAFERVSEQHRIAEAGRFVVHPDARSTGAADELARTFARHLLRELGFHRIELKIYGFNARAIAHAERVGYVREGVKRRAYLKDGEWVDAVLFSLLEDELPE
jgi:RimJ/RimL family protein N-acetyltransferase